MKTLLFVTQFFPDPNCARNTGGTISNRSMLRALAQRYSVTVLSFDSSAEPLRFSGEPYEIFQKSPPTWRAPGLFLNWQSFVREETQERISAGDPPDLLIATTSTLIAFDVAPAQTKCLAVVQAFENFGFHCPWVPSGSRIKFIKGAILRRFQDTRLIRRADGILTNSEFMRSALAKRFAIKSEFIHVLKQQIDFKPVLIRPPENTIGFVHRGADKNIALVLELARRAPDLIFLLYGHSRGLPSSPPQNVSLMGWESDRRTMFASAALWLVPSLWAEPFGRVSMEAQAANRPVLVADRGGLPETVEDPRYKIEGYDPQRWLERMRLLLQLPRKEVEENGARVRERFSRERHDAAVLAAFEYIMKGDAR